jgi:hypothetical protein
MGKMVRKGKWKLGLRGSWRLEASDYRAGASELCSWALLWRHLRNLDMWRPWEVYSSWIRESMSRQLSDNRKYSMRSLKTTGSSTARRHGEWHSR